MKTAVYLVILAIAACSHSGLIRDKAPDTCSVIRNPADFDGQVVTLKLWVTPGIPSFYHSDCLENFLVPVPPYGPVKGDHDKFDELVATNHEREFVGVEAEILARVVWPKNAKGLTDHGLQFLEIRNPRLTAVPGYAELRQVHKRRE
ncbi:MAG: hypothetical protein Q8L84_02390 [Hyphomonas sp.]|nr:hypothetical protein [Hyphomonas sp.]